jgi:hypothetical protein
METVAEKNGQHEPEKKIDPYTEDLLARKAKKEELRRKRLKRASFFWFTVFMYFGLIFVFALFMFKATGILDMLQNLNNKAQQVASRERPARGVVRRSIRTKAEPTSEQTEVIAPPIPNVVIISHSGRMEGVFYKVSGEIENIGTAPAIDVMVTATFYDSSGEPVGKDTDHVWRRVDQLQPSQKFAFSNILPNKEAYKVNRYDLSIKWY